MSRFRVQGGSPAMSEILERTRDSLRFRRPKYLAELSVADSLRKLVFSICAGLPKALPEDMRHPILCPQTNGFVSRPARPNESTATAATCRA